MTIYSGNNPCNVSPTCYTEIEASLERFYNSDANPFRRIFRNQSRMSQKEVSERFHLVIKDSLDQPDRIVVELISIENGDYKPFSEVFDKY